MMRPIALFSLAAALAGCAGGKPCETSTQCGTSEVCASATCQALSCDSVYYAIDPSDGTCRPLPVCGNRDDVRGWAACTNPCASLGEYACIGDPRCQPSYTTDVAAASLCATAAAGDTSAPPSGGCGQTRKFAGCGPNPLKVDPCVGLDQAACTADPRCVTEAIPTPGPCACPANTACDCATDSTVSPAFECRQKGCSDYQSQAECAKHSECTDQGAFNGADGTSPSPTGGGSGPDQPTFPTPAPDGGVPFFGCFPKDFGSCNGLDESSCGLRPDCHPVGESCYCPALATCACGGGKFLFCEPDDGLHRCTADSECGGDQRCDHDDGCAPDPGAGNVVIDGPPAFQAEASPLPNGGIGISSCAGLCVPKGCKGDGEASCNADPACHAIYTLNCSPYGGGPSGADAPPPASGGAPCAFGGGTPASGTGGGTSSSGTSTTGAADGIPATCGQCEPTFSGCVDANPGPLVDADKSVLVRDPLIVDDPAFSFDSVMGKLAGSADPTLFVEAWLAQLGTDQVVAGRAAMARLNAAGYLASLPRRADGHLDVSQLGFQTTSLSNRIDLAGANDCGEARITYALQNGVTDRRHRMTVIVELTQPDDGAQCRIVAQRWVALSKLTGADLAAGLRDLYAPVLSAQGLHQVRTNEFLVGDAVSQGGPNDPAAAWELREWHLGGDGQLHLALSKQAVDRDQAVTPEFISWLSANQSAVVSGSITIPEGFLAVTSSENGGRIQVSPTNGVPSTDLEAALNKSACAGCHTTETNSDFTHVGERFRGTGRAFISEFLRTDLPRRAGLLVKTSQGWLSPATRLAAKPVH